MAATQAPNVAPMANNGVISPPLNPTAIVAIVSANFRIQSQAKTVAATPATFTFAAFGFAKHMSIRFVPRPA